MLPRARRPLVAGWCLLGMALATPAATQTSSPPKYSLDINLLHESLTDHKPVQQEFTLQLTRKLGTFDTLFGAVDQHNRFNELDTELTVGGSHIYPRQRTKVTASYTEGLGADEASEHAFEVKVGGEVNTHFEPEVKYEFKNYDPHLNTSVITLGALVPVVGSFSLAGGYQHSHGPSGDDGDAFSVTVKVNASRNVGLIVGGGYGDEHVLAKTQTEILRFDKKAFTVQGGFSWTIDARRTLGVSYEYQDRISLYRINGLTMDWSQSF
jgi:YaiO family outer membrane protein